MRVNKRVTFNYCKNISLPLNVSEKNNNKNRNTIWCNVSLYTEKVMLLKLVGLKVLTHFLRVRNFTEPFTMYLRWNAAGCLKSDAFAGNAKTVEMIRMYRSSLRWSIIIGKRWSIPIFFFQSISNIRCPRKNRYFTPSTE